MLTSLAQILSFVFDNITWIVFAAIVLWIVFLPQISRLQKPRRKSERYFVE